MKREQTLKLVNIGCGAVFHSAWINLDIKSTSPDVKIFDIRRGLPFSSSEIDACYSSHVLEHLTPSQAGKLLAECFRVLRPKGIIRIVVPDLESIVRSYLTALEQVRGAGDKAQPNYDWMMLEMFDQAVRSTNGGEMGHYLRDPNIENKEFVAARIGMEATQLWQEQWRTAMKGPLWERLKARNSSDLFKQLRLKLAKFFVHWIAGADARLSFSEGQFRRSGEIHCWAYDNYSLGRLLARSKFVDIQVCRADESRIPDFNSYKLDVVDGRIRKPDSLFMEAKKI